MGDLDAKLVLAVQDLESLSALWDQTVTVDEDTVNVEGEGHVLGLLDLLGLNGLDLRGKECPGGLDWRHARAGWAAGDIAAFRVVDGRQTSLAGLPPGDGQGSAEGVARASPVLHGWRDTQVVHVFRSLGDGGAGCWDLDGTGSVVVTGDGKARSLVLAVLGGGGDSHISLLESNHVESCLGGGRGYQIRVMFTVLILLPELIVIVTPSRKVKTVK